MIEIQNLTKHYGPIKAVNNLNFTVEKGEILGFLGPNGAGKTTTMNMITGYLPSTSGTAVSYTHLLQGYLLNPKLNSYFQ